MAPVRGGGRDLLCRVVVETPINLSADQKELLQTFDSGLKESTLPEQPVGLMG